MFKSRVLDFSLGFFGLCLAAASAYLPWHVYQNSGDFGPPKMEFTRADEAGSDAGPLLAQTETEYRRPLFTEQVDSLITGSVRPTKDKSRLKPGAAEPGSISPSDQKFPLELKLIFATRGHALVQDDGDLLVVTPGARLPDGSIVRSIKKVDDLWELITTDSTVLRWQG